LILNLIFKLHYIYGIVINVNIFVQKKLVAKLELFIFIFPLEYMIF